MDSAPGFFGKLPSHGDFITRRLPPSFVAVWDAWLRGCLVASREALGDAWLDAYLNAPVWRFALAPGVCDAHAWGGVVMPSVDRVGRRFPLTLAAGCAGGLPLAQWMGEGGGWIGRLEALALSALDARFEFERFDAALRDMQPLAGTPLPAVPGAHGWRIGIAGLSAAGGAAANVAQAALCGHSVWWTDGSDRVAPCVLLYRALPPAHAFAAMLAG